MVDIVLLNLITFLHTLSSKELLEFVSVADIGNAVSFGKAKRGNLILKKLDKKTYSIFDFISAYENGHKIALIKPDNTVFDKNVKVSSYPEIELNNLANNATVVYPKQFNEYRIFAYKDEAELKLK